MNEPKTPLDEQPVLGALPPEQAAALLREIGEEEAAAQLEEAAEERGLTSFGGAPDWWPFQRAWQHTEHAFGFLEPGDGARQLQYAGAIKPDTSLKNKRVKITLDRLRAADYPGFGEHEILFDFYAQNQVAGTAEDVHFNGTFRVREGEHAPLAGYPIFLGLNVGPDGVAFKCYTYNVKNKSDELFLSFLDSDVFKSGLRLAATLQPAIKPLSAMAVGLAKGIGARNRNQKVQEFYLGLDFSDINTRARLAVGSYVVVQIPQRLSTVWDWNAWEYDPRSGHLVAKDDPTQLIPYNYIVFSVSPYEGE